MTGNEAVGGFVLLLLFGLLFDRTFWFCAISLGLIGTCFAILMWSRLQAKSLARERSQAATAERQHALHAAESTLEFSIARVVEEHLTTLARKRSQLLQPDDYGITDPQRWSKELNHFVQSVLMPRLSSPECYILTRSEEHHRRTVDLLVDAPIAAHAADRRKQIDRIGYRHDLTPREFEHWCADALRQQGWAARATPGSGDQGADVIAEAFGHRVVIQCKLYSKPVGNKAIQEVHSAKTFYEATAAAVVSPMGYTPSAKALALATGVLLLDETDLVNLRRLVARRA